MPENLKFYMKNKKDLITIEELTNSEFPNKRCLILIDANFLLVPIQFGVDIFSEIDNLDLESGRKQLLIPSEVLDELERKSIKEPRVRYKREYKRSIELLKMKLEEQSDIEANYSLSSDVQQISNRLQPKNLLILNDSRIEKNSLPTLPVDDYIVKTALTLKSFGFSIFIATNDKLLRKKAHQRQIPTIFLRQGKKLSVSGRIK